MLEAMSESIDPDVIVITETHLDNTIQSCEFIDTGKYATYRQDRNTHGGGVAIFMKSHLAPYVTDVYEGDDLVAIQLSHQGWKTHLCSYYRPPSNPDFSVLREYLTTVDNNEDVYLLGDFNLPDIIWDTVSVKTKTNRRTLHNEFLETISEFGLTQHVMVPTHEKGNTLDLVITNKPELVHAVEIIPGLSDHYATIARGKNPLISALAAKSSKLPSTRPFYLLHKIDPTAVDGRFKILASRISQMVASRSPIEQVWYTFSEGMSDILDGIPKSNRRGINKSWMTRECLHQIRRRKRAFKRWKNGTGSADT